MELLAAVKGRYRSLSESEWKDKAQCGTSIYRMSGAGHYRTMNDMSQCYFRPCRSTHVRIVRYWGVLRSFVFLAFN